MENQISNYFLSNIIQKAGLIFFILIPIILTENILQQVSYKSNENEIYLTIEGRNIKILSDKFNQIPTQVLINDISSTFQGKELQIPGNNLMDINNVTIKWERALSNCSHMFYNLTDIINIDLTNFNFSNVANTVMMFAHCYKLKSIIFPNSILITNIQYMNNMFYNCSKLETLDLSNFKTTQLRNIDLIFYECNSLTYLDLSNWEFKYIIFSKTIFDELPSLKNLKLSNVKTNLTSMRYVFYKLKHIISLDLSNFYTSNIINMFLMFANSTKLRYLDLTNFDTRQVQIMWYMFDGCISLTSLDLSSFDTSQVTDFDQIFRNLHSLVYIKLNFNMNKMHYKSQTFDGTNNFQYCIIDESQMTFFYDLIRSLSNTIRDCSKKCYPDIRKLDKNTNKCILFNCNNNITYKYIYNYNCVKKCPKRSYLVSNITNLCEDLNCSFYYNYEQTGCIDEIPKGYYLNDSKQKTIDKCHPNCRECDKKATLDNNNCKSCIPNKYFYYGNCITNCPNGYYVDKNDTSNKICKCSISKCLSCPLENSNLCYSCNEPYYQIYNDSLNIFPYVNCYKDPEGYYFNSIDKIYKPCYKSCKTCTSFGDEKNNNCLICNLNYTKRYEYLNDTNCYKNCSFYYYFDNNRNYFCTNEEKCDNIIFNKLIEQKKKCIDSCKKDNKYKYEFKKKCYEECPINTKNNNYYCEIECPEDYPYEIKDTQECVKNCSFDDITKQLCILNNKNAEQANEQQNEIATNIQENLMNGGINTSSVINGEDIVIQGKETSFTITTTENQKNSENKNVSTINLGECETKLKNHYNISQNKSLFIFKVEVLKEGMKVPKIEYEVYFPLKGDNLEKLDLSICDDTKIELSIPVSINEKDLEKHDSTSKYYNDICYSSTSENGTDISLADRKNKFVNNNLTLCEEDCEFKGYDSNTKKALCSCEVKISLPLISEINIDKKKLFNSFSDIKNIANLDLMKCYNTLFSKKGIIRNYGFFILLSNIFLFIICLIIFYSKEHKKIKIIIYGFIIYKINKKEIKSITSKYKILKEKYKKEIKNKTNKIKKEKKKFKNREKNNSRKNLILKDVNDRTKESKEIETLNNYEDSNENEFKNDIINLIIQVNKLDAKIKKYKSILLNKKIQEDNPPSKKSRALKVSNFLTTNIKTSKDEPNKIIANLNNKNNNIKFIPKRVKKKIKRIKKYGRLMKLNDSELNNLEYKDALKSDKRAFCQYYFSLIKTKHLIAFTFFPIEDYNSRLIKISMFIFSISIYLTVNALFFSDSTMHQIYEDNGNFNFIYQLPQILYSAIISGFLDAIIRALALTQNNVLKIKHEKKQKKLNGLALIILKTIFYKTIFFYLISFIVLLVCWYYLSCFCCIYKNTQLHLIKDTLISFSLSLVYPFGIYLIPGIFRIYALRNEKKDKDKMYKFSRFIQNI